MRLYIAGPMRGFPEFNFPAFDQAAATLRAQGHQAVSPAEHDRKRGLDETLYPNGEWDDLTFEESFLRDAFAWDLQQVCYSDGVVVLPGWQNSKGAQLEVRTALLLGIPIYRLTRSTNRLVLVNPEAHL